LTGLNQLARAFLGEIFPEQATRKAGEWADATTAIAEGTKKVATPLENFINLVGRLASSFQASPQVAALGKALSDLALGAGRALIEAGKLVALFVRPFIPQGVATDVDSLLTALSKLGTGSAADTAASGTQVRSTRFPVIQRPTIRVETGSTTR